jgi:hypothetical protein
LERGREKRPHGEGGRQDGWEIGGRGGQGKPGRIEWELNIEGAKVGEIRGGEGGEEKGKWEGGLKRGGGEREKEKERARRVAGEGGKGRDIRVVPWSE